MGQKTNPNLFRKLIKKQNNNSSWYISKHEYKTYILEDYLFRTYIEKVFHNIVPIADIKIIRNSSSLRISLSIFFPQNEFRLSEIIHEYTSSEESLNKIPVNFGKLSSLSKEELLNAYKFIINIYINRIKENILKSYNKSTSINIIPVYDEYSYASLIAKNVAYLIEKRIPFKRVIKDMIDKVSNRFETIGIKIQVSGRLNGTDIARTEWEKAGKVPLQTISANINYYFAEAKTIYGLIGVKVWLFL